MVIRQKIHEIIGGFKKMANIDEIDKEILKMLQQNARTPFKDMAEKVNKAPATVKNRIEKMQAMGIIKAYVPLLDYKFFGYMHTTFIMLLAKPGKLDVIEKMLEEEKNVIAAYETTGEFDLAIIARFRNEEEISNFVRKLLETGYVERTVTSMVLKVIKEDPRIPIE